MCEVNENKLLLIAHRHYAGDWKYVYLYSLLLGLLIGHSLILLNTLITGSPINLLTAAVVLWCSVWVSLGIAYAIRQSMHWRWIGVWLHNKPQLIFYLTLFVAGLLASEWAIFSLNIFSIRFTGLQHRNLVLLNSVVWTVVVGSIIWGYEWQKGRFYSHRITQDSEVVHLKHVTRNAQLTTIQTKINPHFLYNALNSIASLISVDVAKAEDMTLKLAQLYQYSAKGENDAWISIVEELHIAKNYLEIERIRFGDVFSYELHCDSTLLKQAIPRFLIQPLLENSVKHGFTSAQGKVWVKLSITRNKEHVMIEVFDNGLPFPKTVSAGYGLSSTYARLKLHFGNRYEVKLLNQPQKCISISIPLHSSSHGVKTNLTTSI